MNLPVLNPEAGAVEAGEEPLVGVGADRISELDPFEVGAELRADEGGPGVGGVDVEPHRRELPADQPDLLDVVERADRRRPQRRRHVERDHPHRLVLHHHLSE